MAGQRINVTIIIQHWEDLLRLAGSLKLGTVQASGLIRTLQTKDRPTKLARALEELGRLIKTLYLLRFIDDEAYRRRILVQLNRGEGRHQLARIVFHGKRGELRQRYREGQEDQLGALGLLVNVIVLWNSAQDAGVGLRKLFEHDPPYGARVSFEVEKARSGWNAAPFPAWLTAALELGSRIAFGEGVGMSGSGDSIPLMGILATMFPAAQFVITGVFGPGSNAHGPDEFLDVATAEGVTSAVAVIIAAESEHSSKPLNRFG